MLRFLRAQIRAYVPSRECAAAWLQRHPVAAAVLERMGCLHVHRRTLARGLAVGLFVGLTPTVGLQTALMLAACALVRGNFPVAFAASWISNPFTVAPLYYGFNRLGESVFGDLVGADLVLSGAIEQALTGAAYLALGSLLIAGPVALASYGAFIWTWRLLVIRRRRLTLLTRAAGPPREPA